MKILISTGIYPPKIGGPAEYSKNLKSQFITSGHKVFIATYSLENYLPTGLRHLYFFIKIMPKVLRSDFVLIMDTFSVGLPTVLACKLFGKKSIIRTGGDFLWEGFVERTGKKVLLRDFYEKEINNFSAKERIIFRLTKWTLKNTSKIVFSTQWQREIFKKPYDLEMGHTEIIENFYGSKEGDFQPKEKDFVASTRRLVWKNTDLLKEVFQKIKSRNNEVSLFSANLPFAEFMEKIKNCYAVIQVSLGDISPNMILDAIRYNRPFICTKEVGIYDRIGDVGIFVDPLNEKQIEEAVLKLLDKNEYEKAKEKVKQFSFVHTWQSIATEFMGVYNKIK